MIVLCGLTLRFAVSFRAAVCICNWGSQPIRRVRHIDDKLVVLTAKQLSSTVKNVVAQ
jgi:hypothetical protein